MPTLLSEKVLRPLGGLTNTAAAETAAIPPPVLHAFSSERRAALKIPAGTPFYEETTFWDPSWTITHGAIQTSNIYDLEATAVGIGSGRLLSAESYRRMVSTELRGKTRTQPGCTTCAEMTDGYTYGWVSSSPGTGCCRTRCSPGTPPWRPTYRRARSPSRSRSRSPPRMPSTIRRFPQRSRGAVPHDRRRTRPPRGCAAGAPAK